ncbi:hypothetical protein [Bacillus sp. FJAT-28004]|nr:hypothetical protein [Bacillus sp. FJAT-28004]
MDITKLMKYVEDNKEEYYKELLAREAAELEEARKKNAEKKAPAQDE